MERSCLASIIVLLVLVLPLAINIGFDRYKAIVKKTNQEINEGLKHYYRFSYICHQICKIPIRKIKLEEGAFVTYITHWSSYSSLDVEMMLGEVEKVPLSNKQRAFILKAYGDALIQVLSVDKLAFIYEQAVFYQMAPKMRMGYAPQNFILKLVDERLSCKFAREVIRLMCARLAKEHDGEERSQLCGRICEFEKMNDIKPYSYEKMYKIHPQFGKVSI